MVALAFVRAHYPEVDLELLKTLPPSPVVALIWSTIMLLAEARPIVSLNRLSPKVIIREQTRASQCPELAMYLYLVYILYMYVFVGVCLGALSGLCELCSKALERMSKGRNPRV
jgi:hypothetical protein